MTPTEPPNPSINWTLTIARVMLDVAVLAFALAGLAAPQNPVVATLSFAGLCYFAFRFWFLAGPPLVRCLFRPTGEPEEEPQDDISWVDD